MKKFITGGMLTFFLIGCAGTGGWIHPAENELAIVRPKAQTVFFASSMDGYTPHATKKGKQGRWTVTAPAETEFRYFFIVDGKPSIPPCLYRETDDFGAHNCIFTPEP